LFDKNFRKLSATDGTEFAQQQKSRAMHATKKDDKLLALANEVIE
jgi:hypothetical protein